MTAKEFGEWAQGYYGPYEEGQKRDIWEYLKQWEPAYLNALKTVLLKNYSSQFKRPPDIAAMDKLYIAASSEQAAQERIKRAVMLPPPAGGIESDQEKTARLYADIEAAGTSMDEPGWFQKTLEYRIARGDYKNAKQTVSRGGAIHVMKETSSPKPLTTWEDLGGMAK